MPLGFVAAMYSFRNVFIYFSISLSIPSALLYCTQIATIIRHRQFHNAFYALFVARAIVDLVCLANSYWGYRFPYLFGDLLEPAYGHLPAWTIALYFFLTYYTFHAENLAVDFILLNRLSAIAIPLLHDKLWRRFLPLALFVIFAIPIAFSFFLFNMDATILVIKNDPAAWNGTTLVLYENSTTHYLTDNSIVCGIAALVFLFTSILINLAIFIVYKRKKRTFDREQPPPHQQEGGRKGAVMNLMEKKLLVYAITSFIGHLLGTIFLVGVYICLLTGDYLTMVLLLAQAPWIADLGSIVMPSWMLLWASSNFRQQWAQDFVPKLVVLLGRKLMGGKQAVHHNVTNVVNVLPPQNVANSSIHRPTISFMNNPNITSFP